MTLSYLLTSVDFNHKICVNLLYMCYNLWSIIGHNGGIANREKFGALLKSIIGNLKSIIGSCLPSQIQSQLSSLCCMNLVTYAHAKDKLPNYLYICDL